jgi:tRNA threonylcarbamoyl adenosine modification protein YeaZ
LAAWARSTEEHGLAAALPKLVEGVLDISGRGLDLVAVAVGPGSFTGLRAGISVATGIALALSIPVVGVSVAEALAEGLPVLDGRTLWVAITARRGRVFIDTGNGVRGYALDALPRPTSRLAIAGNAANFLAGALAAAGADVMLTAGRMALAEHVAAVGVQRSSGARAPLSALPLYVDAPEAKPPAAGLRGAPV